MSADNILIILKSPRREGEGDEWHVLELNFSGYHCPTWQAGLSDDLIVAISGAYRRRRFESEDDAEDYVDWYTDENIVEYGVDHHVIDFPFPSDEEIAAAEKRWEADQPMRELILQMECLASRVRDLQETDLRLAQTSLMIMLNLLEDPEFEPWHDSIRDHEIPERKEMLATLQQELTMAKVELGALAGYA